MKERERELGGKELKQILKLQSSTSYPWIFSNSFIHPVSLSSLSSSLLTSFSSFSFSFYLLSHSLFILNSNQGFVSTYASSFFFAPSLSFRFFFVPSLSLFQILLRSFSLSLSFRFFPSNTDPIFGKKKK